MRRLPEDGFVLAEFANPDIIRSWRVLYIRVLLLQLSLTCGKSIDVSTAPPRLFAWKSGICLLRSSLLRSSLLRSLSIHIGAGLSPLCVRYPVRSRCMWRCQVGCSLGVAGAIEALLWECDTFCLCFACKGELGIGRFLFRLLIQNADILLSLSQRPPE